MKNKFVFGMLMIVTAVGLSLSPVVQAAEATATATTTAVTATTTATTTPVVATTTGPVSSTIAGLLAQLAKLTELFNSLKAQMMGVSSEIKELKGDLREGMTDADIKAIQEALASDPTIYPRGLITGYFGPMTKEAIMKFQAKNGLEVTGEIDTETKAALDTIMEQRRAEGKFPVGLLLNPGFKNKFEDRVKSRCSEVASSSSNGMCMKLNEKYKFPMGGMHGSSTKPMMHDDDKMKKERGLMMSNDKKKMMDDDMDKSDDTDDDSDTSN